MDVHIQVTGDRRVGLRFEKFPDDLRANLTTEIDSLSKELMALIEAAVPKRTGSLSAHIRQGVNDDPNSLKGFVYVTGVKGSQDFAKAAALEYGAHKPTKVKAHGMKLDHFWADKLNEPINVMVAAYSRTPDIAAHDFLRGPLAAIAPEAQARLEAVVAKTVAETNA